MKHIEHAAPQKTYNIALLIKESTFKQDLIEAKYINPLSTMGIQPEEIISFSLAYNDKGKAPAKLIKQYLSSLLIGLNNLGVKTLLVADAAYFKVLTRVRKTEPEFGNVVPCKIETYEHMNVILSVNYAALFYNPKLQEKIDMSLRTLADYITGFHIKLGTGIIHSAHYPNTIQDVKLTLLTLQQCETLTCDIETFSLSFDKAGIGTIAFAWNQHEGVAFPVDYNDVEDGNYSNVVRTMLKVFFKTYKGKLIYHGSTFDIKVLIYNLFMDDLLDYAGLLKGLEIFYKNMDDTKIITYLAINSTTRNKLGLKELAFEFAGNWAEEEINDIRKIPISQLLEYNLIDTLATWYVHNKYYPIMVADDQETIYKELFRPSLKVITQMELTGMPLDMETVIEKYNKLDVLLWQEQMKLKHNPVIIEFEDTLRKEEMLTKNLLLKRTTKTLHSFVDVEYNPASNKQTRRLLYDEFGFEVIDTTDTGLPAVGNKTIKKLLTKLKKDFSITDEELR